MNDDLETEIVEKTEKYLYKNSFWVKDNEEVEYIIGEINCKSITYKNDDIKIFYRQLKQKKYLRGIIFLFHGLAESSG
jgi:hypothetical protein